MSHHIGETQLQKVYQAINKNGKTLSEALEEGTLSTKIGNSSQDTNHNWRMAMSNKSSQEKSTAASIDVN